MQVSASRTRRRIFGEAEVHLDARLPRLGPAIVGGDAIREVLVVVLGAKAADALVVAAEGLRLLAPHVLPGIDAITRVVKVVGFVASAPGFMGQPGVINGASELFGEVFGDAGAHARSAVGVAELPLDAPVEVEVIVEVA